MELILPRHGTHEKVSSPQTAVIAGGGLAGVAAAVVLAERGVSVVLAERTLSAIESRVRAGRAPKAELMRARAELAIERLASDDVSHEKSVAYHRLAAQWGETAPQFERVEGELVDLPTVASFEDLAGRIEKNPQLERIASEQRIAEARLRLARASRWPLSH